MKKTNIFRRIILPILIVLVLIFAAIAKLGSNKEKMDAKVKISEKMMTVFPVTVVNPNMETITQDFSINGEFIPDHELKFLSEVAGRVRKLNVENGDYVTQGKVIAVIDNEQTQIDLNLAEITLEKAKSDLEKYENMLKGNAVSKQQVEEARIGVRRAESNVKSLKRQRDLASIVAPISGVISNLSVEKGSFLSPGAPIADIVDIKSLKMSVKLLDNQVIRVNNGQTVRISPDLYKGVTITGTVASVSPQADGSKKYATEIRFTNPSKTPLKSGMTGDVKFTFGGTKTALTIPIKCLVGSTKNPKVYIVEGGKAKLVSIQAGSIENDKLEIISGLSERMQVVSTGQLNLSKGSKVKIID